MSEMIERVARAIYEATPRNKPYTILTKFKRDALEAEARAAIEAVKEPTQDMKSAAREECATTDIAGDEDFEAHYASVWRTMIDAALSTDDVE